MDSGRHSAPHAVSTRWVSAVSRKHGLFESGLRSLGLKSGLPIPAPSLSTWGTLTSLLASRNLFPLRITGVVTDSAWSRGTFGED